MNRHTIPTKKSTTRNDKVRKVLVRNPVTLARPCEVVKETKRVQFADDDEEVKKSDPKDFQTPEFCSILKLADEIKKVQLKPQSELWKKEVEDGSKQVNVDFDPDEKLFCDLISVEKPMLDHRPRVKSSTSFKNTLKKDPEPDFKELLKYDLQPEYKFTRVYYPEFKKPVPQFDGRSVYRLTKRLTVHNTY